MDGFLKSSYFYFSQKIRCDISDEMADDSHEIKNIFFFLKKKKKKKYKKQLRISSVILVIAVYH